MPPRTTIAATTAFPEPDFPFACTLFTGSSKAFPPHTHEFTEIVVVFQGYTVDVINGRDHALSAGSVVVMSGNDTHATLRSEHCRELLVQCDLERLGIATADLQVLPGYHLLFDLEPRLRRHTAHTGLFKLDARGTAHAESLAQRLFEEWRARHPGYRFFVITLLRELIGFLCRAYTAPRLPSSHHLLRISNALAYIHQHYDEPISIAALERCTKMQHATLRRAFVSALGTTPLQYIIQHRLLKAAHLLRTTDHSITDIGIQVGFCDGNYFTRMFRKILGVTPRRFRAMNDLTAQRLQHRLALPVTTDNPRPPLPSPH
ncbi:MAG: helix-turn-helix domain-containing protein [bacterium]|nr:helix-turn-helix domain-containing protein [bacterium]